MTLAGSARIYDLVVWAGMLFDRCANCGRATIDPLGDGWRYYADAEGDPHGFCARCVAREFGARPPEATPVAVCPTCDDTLHPQPRGGWVCVEHGMIVAPKVAVARPD
jgi:DNA-directed RNA polymerase subunit RPC12/RpoP